MTPPPARLRCPAQRRFAALGKVARNISGRRAILSYMRGSSKVIAGLGLLMVLVGCTSVSEPLLGEWRSQQLDGASMVVKPDGSFDGFDGCNAFAGRLHPIPETQNSFQIEVKGVGTQGCLNGEGAWAYKTEVIEFDGSGITAFDSQGTSLGEFTR